MAENDDASRTEEPTPQRLQQARQKGQVALSQDVKTWALLAGAALALAALAPLAANAFMRGSLRFIEHPERIVVDRAEVQAGFAAILVDLAMILAPTIGLLALLALAAGIGQSGLIWAPERIKPDFGKISPLKGFGRLVSAHSLIEFVKGLIKLGFVSAVLATTLTAMLPGLDLWSSLPVRGAVDHTQHLLIKIAFGVAAAAAVLAILDFAYQRFSFLQQMRMTVEEVREEFKQSEGDPHIKARIRQLRQERARHRMMAAVPNAAVVITNPTHVSVALAYEAQAMQAPKVVAKGADHLAQRIREVAREHGVPIVENPPLARALHASVDIEQEIPAEHYEAVAQVIAFVMGRDRGRRAN